MDAELLDTFDDQGRHLGVLERTEVHRRGLWHQVAHFLLVAHRDETPTAVLQRRGWSKSTFPGLVDLSATGHLAAGERPRQGVRELREELGIDIEPDALVGLGIRRMVDTTPEGINRELVHVFLGSDDRPLEDYRPDAEEVAGVIEVPIEALLAVLDPDPSTPAVAPAVEVAAGGEPRRIELTALDLVPEPTLIDVVGGHPFAYWVSVLSAGLGYAEGRRPLAI